LDFSSENKADWIKVFNDLIDRGLKRVMLIVSDDFPGITKAIETLFPSRKKFLSWFMTSSKTDSKSFLIPIFS
jgi:Transposase, Mutator family.